MHTFSSVVMATCRTVFVAVTFVFLGAFFLPAQAAPYVLELQVEGVISPASSDFIVRGLDKAAAQDAELVVITLDTPGGLDTSMRSIVRHILASPVPVATYVGPAGARAASAGTFILYASHIAAMSPVSNLGAATPVQIGAIAGRGKSSQAKTADTPATAEDDTTASDDKPAAPAGEPSGDSMSRKAANDAAAYLRSLAQLRGRNMEFAEKAVYEAASMSAQEALDNRVIDLLANNVHELVKQLDGREVTLAAGETIQLNTADAKIERIEPDWRNRLLSLIANPQVALILMMIGVYGLFYEVTSPGLGLPGVAGLICLLLALYAFQLLPVNWAGVALVFVGLSLMVAEVFLPSFGLLGTGGVIAFVLGGLFLTDTGVPGFDLSIPFLFGVAIVSAALLSVIATMAVKSHTRKVVSGREQMIGLDGIVTSVEEGVAYAHVRGESWQVKSNVTLNVGDHVKVEHIEGLVLTVRRVASNTRQTTA